MIRPLAFVWVGIVIGVSFLATPVKFTVDSLSRPVALDVGRTTFHALAYLEWGLAVALGTLAWREHLRRSTRRDRSNRILFMVGVVLLALVAQGTWLLPALDERVASIIAGVEPPASHLHTLYGAVEVTKVVALGLLALWAEPSTSHCATEAPPVGASV